ncbi:hypothetical protein AcV7_008600 [Taiwanofungus camphoratus]|nr:hypothetical protein AcV7_008600 [Antrodia cinnamomea]
MPSTTTQSRTPVNRGRRGNRGRGGNRGIHRDTGKAAAVGSTSKTQNEEVQGIVKTAESKATDATEGDDSAVCWICAEPVKYYSLSECNHRTCHVCALRLRALYKKQECTFCKEPQPSVVFTRSPDALWSSYTPDMIPYKDSKLSISFESQEMMEDTLILLRFNCPDADCDYIGNGWSDLKLHTRAVHEKLMCDLCIRFKKVFAHEHALYLPNQLYLHLPSMRPNRSYGLGPSTQRQIEGGIHPICEFCRECFFGDDELYAHMRERHEECFICKRNDVRDQYFRNYDALEQHFMHAHHPCTQPQCLAHKFVVFGSVLDLKAHMVEEHGAEMSARDRKDVRRVHTEFEFEEAGSSGRRGRRNRRDREHEQEPPPVTPGYTQSNAAGARRREAFGGNLTIDGRSVNLATNAASSHSSQRPSRHQTPSPPDEGEQTIAEKNSVLVARLTTLISNPVTAVPAIQAAIRSYRVSESGARDVISTVWNILDRNLDGAAGVINLLIDLIDEEDKRRDLLAAWNGFKIEQRARFPELVPTTTGTEWAGVTSGRVLNAKHSTAQSSSQSSRQVWDRVARAAASSSSTASPVPSRTPERFPSLQSVGPSTTNSLFRQPQRNTPWTSVAAAAPISMRGPTSIPGPGADASTSRRQTAPALSKSAFPELPSAKAMRVPKTAVSGNQSLRNILGDSTPTVPAWETGKNGTIGTNGTTTLSPGDLPAEDENEIQQPKPAKGKKGKGKQKQALFTLGSFPI